MSEQTNFPIVGTREVQIGSNTGYRYTKDYVNEWGATTVIPTRAPNSRIQMSEAGSVLPQIGTNAGYQKSKGFVNAWGHPIEYVTREPKIQSPETYDESVYNFGVVFNKYPDKYWVPQVLPSVREQNFEIVGGVSGDRPARQAAPPMSWWQVDQLPKMAKWLIQFLGESPALAELELFDYLPDKWVVGDVLPQRNDPQGTQVPTMFTQVPPTAFTLFVDKYWAAFVEPNRFTKPIIQDLRPHPQLISWSERVQVDKFQLPIQQPVAAPDRPNQPSATAHFLIWNLGVITYISQWHQDATIPRPWVRGPQDKDLTRSPQQTNWTERTQVDKWWYPIAEPVRKPARPNQPAASAHLVRSLIESITMDKWNVPMVEPVRFGKRIQTGFPTLTQAIQFAQQHYADKWTTMDVLPSRRGGKQSIYMVTDRGIHIVIIPPTTGERFNFRLHIVRSKSRRLYV